MQNKQVELRMIYSTMKFWAGEWAEYSAEEKNKCSRAYYTWAFDAKDRQTGLMSEAIWDGAEDEEGNKTWYYGPGMETMVGIKNYKLLTQDEIESIKKFL